MDDISSREDEVFVSTAADLPDAPYDCMGTGDAAETSPGEICSISSHKLD